MSLRTGSLHAQDDKGSHSSIAASWDTNNLRAGPDIDDRKGVKANDLRVLDTPDRS